MILCSYGNGKERERAGWSEKEVLSAGVCAYALAAVDGD